MKTENQENYSLDDRNFQTNESSVTEPITDESTSYVDQYENIPLDDDNPEEETIVNEEDSITNDQDNLDQEFLDALHEDEEEEEIYDDQNNLDKNQNNLDKGDHLTYPDLEIEEQKTRNREEEKNGI